MEIQLALWLSGALVIYTLYRAYTEKLAMTARGRLLAIVKSILSDEEAPQSLKESALGAFHYSLGPNMIISGMVKKRSTKRNGVLPNERYRAKNNDLVREFLRVNILAGPHWYLLLMALFIVMVFLIGVFTLGRASSRALIYRFESAIRPPLIH